MDNKIEKIRSLVNELNEASDAYYNSGNPIMSDLEFDIRFKELQRLEEEYSDCFDEFEDGYAQGWNNCIEEIFG